MALCASACGGSGEPATGPGGGSVVVVASAGTTPTYTWSGPTAVSINVVRTTAPQTPVWAISSLMARNIPSGTQQGAVPSGATETVSDERVLTPGVRYRVTVSLNDATSGSVDFTP
jgi:hypothetical protein